MEEVEEDEYEELEEEWRRFRKSSTVGETSSKNKLIIFLLGLYVA